MRRPFIAAIVATVLCTWLCGAAFAQHGHGAHPPMPNQQYQVRCQVPGQADDTTIIAQLQMPTAVLAATLEQEIALPDLPPLRVTRYLPQAKLEQEVVSATGADDALPAILLAIKGPKQSFERWLVAGDEQRNRLTSFIGTWRYMSVQNQEQRDELYAMFESELTRPPMLHVTRLSDGKTVAVPAETGGAGASEELAELGCRMRMQRFAPHFAMDKTSGQPITQSDKRVNPAALVLLEYEGKREERWVFAKFPDFKMSEEQTLPFRVTLDCPIESERPTPDYAVVTTGATSHEAWSRHEGNTTSQTMDENTQVPVAGSNYAFSIAKFVPSGRLIERYVEVDRRGEPAIKLETVDKSGKPVELWVPLAKSHTLPTARGPVRISFEYFQPAGQGAHGVRGP